VTQGELTDIWEALDLGHAVSGWGRMIGGGGNDHVLLEISADHAWSRNAAVEPWVKTPRVADGHC
jgi:hypothetical protein